MNNKEGLNVIVTGGLGHIGSCLIRELPSPLVKKIIILDNLESQRYCSLFNLSDKYQYQFIEGDIRTADLDKIFSDGDVVIHLAALTNAEASHVRAQETESVNFEGLKRVADACVRNDVKLFFPSTTSVYGSQEKVVDENCLELRPQSPYAEAKLSSEKHLQSMKDSGLKFAICRFGTIFGFSPGIRFHTAVNKFTWQAVNGQPLTVWKTAWQQKRPYLFLGDGVQAISFIIENDLFDSEIYNVLTNNFTVEDIVNAIKKYVPNLQINYVDSPIMNQLSYDVDDTKFRQKGFAPKGDLLVGLGETIDKLKKIIN